MVQEVAGSNPVGHPPYLGEQLKYKIKNTSDFEKELDLKVDNKDLEEYKDEAIKRISKNLKIKSFYFFNNGKFKVFLSSVHEDATSLANFRIFSIY